ncbi:MAG: protoporphyrinogen oxidase [Nitrospinota bacterium]
MDGRGEVEADAVCVAAPAGPAGPAARLVREAAPRLAASLEGIPCGSVGTLNLVFREEQAGRPLNGMGFVVPAVEGRALLACSFSSMKFEGRAPEGKILLRAFFTGTESEGPFSLPEEEVKALLTDELRAVLGIRGEPEVARLARYPRSMPQFRLGHLERVRAIEEETEKLPGLAVAGCAYRGVGIPDCAESANDAAARLADYLRRS